jgi:hypothetical protein
VGIPEMPVEDGASVPPTRSSVAGLGVMSLTHYGAPIGRWIRRAVASAGCSDGQSDGTIPTSRAEQGVNRPGSVKCVRDPADWGRPKRREVDSNPATGYPVPTGVGTSRMAWGQSGRQNLRCAPRSNRVSGLWTANWHDGPVEGMR